MDLNLIIKSFLIGKEVVEKLELVIIFLLLIVLKTKSLNGLGWD